MYVARTKIRGTKSNAKPISEDKDTYVVIYKYVIPTMDYSMLRDSRRVKKNDSRLIYVLIATFFFTQLDVHFEKTKFDAIE